MGSAAEVVTVALPAADGVGWGHGAAARRTAQQPLQQGTELVPYRSASRPALVLELVLHLLPGVSRDDSRLLAVVEFVLVVDFADVGDPGQQPVQIGFGEWSASADLPVASPPALGPPAAQLSGYSWYSVPATFGRYQLCRLTRR